MIKRVQAGQPIDNSAARANEIADKVNSITLRPGASRGMGNGAVGVVMVENLTADDWRGGQPIRLSGASTSVADIVLTGNSVFVGGYSGHVVAVTARPILAGEIGPAIVSGVAIVTGLPEDYDPAEHFGLEIDEDDGTLTAAASGAVTLIGGVAGIEEDIILGIEAVPAVAVALLGGGSAGSSELTVITTRPNGGYGPAFDATITLAADGNWSATGTPTAVIVPKQV